MTRKQSKRIVRAAWKEVGVKPPKLRKLHKRTISRVSKRRARENVVYAKKKKEFLEEHSTCSVCSCWVRPENRELHHWAGRGGKLFLEEKLWLMVCPYCHSFIHLNPNYGRREGYLAPPGCWNDYKRAMAARPEVRK